MATEIRLDKLRREFGSLVAVNDVSITFPAESVTCLLGPSGCGKTTLMRMIAGLEEPTSGDIYFGNERVTELSSSERKIGMVFQYPVVYRNVTLFDNVELPLKNDKSLSSKARKERVHSVLETLGLAQYAQENISRLDNATRQKAAVARAVARQPQIILFDEPITNVDVNAKVQLKRALKQLVKQHAQTIIYVTHDQTEAMTLADEIALMQNGKVLQRGVPSDIYNDPSSVFGGWFLGNPGMNFVEHAVEYRDGQAMLSAPLFGQPVAVQGLNGLKTVTVGIRPERVRVGGPTATSVKGDVLRTSIVVGGQSLATIKIGETLIKAKVSYRERIEPGMTVNVDLPAEHVCLFSAEGDRLDAAVAVLA